MADVRQGSIKLNWKGFGGAEEAEPLVVLHGLLGSLRNWQGAAKRLSSKFRVYGLDLRNHGGSPHANSMQYADLAGDVLAWAAAELHGGFHLLGHSMGGKVAMRLAVDQPNLVKTLTVLDIAPRGYAPRWQREFEIMREMPVADFESRTAAEAWLEPHITDWAFRKFLITNLERSDEGGFRWVVNLGILQDALPDLFRQVPEDGESFSGPTLFLRGSKSRFVDPVSDADQIKRHFPAATIATVEGAGHNVHFDQPEAFAEALEQFIGAAQ